MRNWVEYVSSFYGPGGLYAMGATPERIAEATKVLVERGDDVAYDSVDREKVRDILIERFGLVFPCERRELAR